MRSPSRPLRGDGRAVPGPIKIYERGCHRQVQGPTVAGYAQAFRKRGHTDRYYKALPPQAVDFCEKFKVHWEGILQMVLTYVAQHRDELVGEAVEQGRPFTSYSQHIPRLGYVSVNVYPD